jgi:hypothetical protein
MRNISRRTCRKKRRKKQDRRRQGLTKKKELQNLEIRNDYELLIRQFLMELNTLFQRYPAGVSLLALIQLMNYVQTNYVQWPVDDERLITGIDLENVQGLPFMSESEIDSRLQYANMDLSGLIDRQATYLSNMVGGKNIKDLMKISRVK